MKSKLWNVGGMIALVVAMSWVLQPAKCADESQTPTVKEIMGKVNKGKTALFSEVKADLKAQPVDWDHVAEHSKEMLDLIKSMPKNDPPKGDAESWKKATSAYVKNATALNEAVKAKSKPKADEAVKKIGSSCMGCHNNHK